VAFGGRVLKKTEHTGKYVNSPESEIYHKGNELYGIFFAKQAIAKADCCFLVEGYTDVISMHQTGIENVVASSGTALPQGQIRLSHRFTNNVTGDYDGDAAGIKAALRGIDLLLEEGMNIKVILLPDGEDPDSFAKKQNAESLAKYIRENEVDFIRFKTKLLLGDAGNDPIKRAALITDIVGSISVIPDNIIRTVYIKDCSALLDIDERILVQEVRKKRLAHVEKAVPPQIELESAVAGNGLSQIVVPNQPNAEKQTIAHFERGILYYIVRYGMEVLFVTDGTPTTVIDWVKFDLGRDGLRFTNPIYKLMLDEAIEHSTDETFVPAHYFLTYPNADVSRVAAELISDRYRLSKVHIKQFGENVKKEDTPLSEEKHLDKDVLRMVAELKNAYIAKQIKEVMDEMASKQKDGDSDAVMSLMQQVKDLEEIKKALAKILGERIILKW
jgi:DNA primase